MIINIDEAQNKFLDYTKEFDHTSDKILRKISHSLRVKNISKEIAENTFKTSEEKDLAELIGLLHDIGRFEQARKTNSFIDGEFDHANEGEKILSENNYIREYIKDDKYDDIILKAIRNHNKFEIEKGLNETEKKYAEIIRDADKIDILYLYATINDINYLIEGANIEETEISPEVLEAFFETKQLNRKTLKYFLDYYINTIAFIFDLNEKYSFQYLKEKNYMNSIIDNIQKITPSRRDDFEKIRIFINEYIERKAE